MVQLLWEIIWHYWASLIAQLLKKNLLAMQETPVQFLGQEDPLEKGKATHSSILGLLCGSAGKDSACNTGNLGSIPGLGRSLGEGKGFPLQYSGLENSVDYTSPWGCKESDTTEQFSLHSTLISTLYALSHLISASTL